mmetsp:Transcript_31592/g.75063  ORF Transcript_31592/g.75063 Transcript_31592/m.75063 type:complete len:121 (+) Transcript_31592:207-569(+)
MASGRRNVRVGAISQKFRRGPSRRSAFFLSKNAPYYIHDVISAMDINGWTQGEPRYQNPFIQRGDVLMAIEEEDVTHADFDLIKDLLSGEDRSLLRCTFNRAGNESTFTVQLMRHRVVAR